MSVNNSTRIFAELERKVKVAAQRAMVEMSDRVVELTDRNFTSKSFFGETWQPNTTNQPILIHTGRLRQSIRVLSRSSYSAKIGSLLPYASIHNKGGTFNSSPQQISFMWAKYRETKKDIYKNIAIKLQKGGKISIPQRQFIGAHSTQTAILRQILLRNLKNMNNY